ncbi:hypothetical protein ACXYMT_13955 [Salinimicrobium sp. CAU 1759]
MEDETSYSVLTNGLVHTNKKFVKRIYEKNLEKKGNIVFRGCQFDKNIIFDNLKAGEIFFENCIFNDLVHFFDAQLNFLTFSECKFNVDITLSSNRIRVLKVADSAGKRIHINGEYRLLQIVNSEFDNATLKDVNTEYSHQESTIQFLKKNSINKVRINSSSNYSNLSIKGNSKYKWFFLEGTFYSKINFDKQVEVKHLFFSSGIFKNRIDFQEGIYADINFARSSFHEVINFHGFNVLDNWIKDLSIGDLNIYSCEFLNTINVNTPRIKSLNLSNNNFQQQFHFNNYLESMSGKEYVAISVSGSNQGNIILENAQADISLSDVNMGNIYFKNIKISFLTITDFQNEGNISFANIRSGNYFVIENSIVGNLNFLNENLNLFKEIVIANSNLKGMVLSIYPKKIYSSSTNPKIGFGLKDNRLNHFNLKNVYNQLKFNAQSNGDIDVRNKYEALEYRQLIEVKGLSWDALLLTLNWLSNDFGNSWLRGIVFTLTVGFFFFLIYLGQIGVDLDLENIIKEYFLFISSFPKLSLEQYEEFYEKWDVSIIILLSRIFISYGIYQTITAFRKFGKH